MYHYALSISSDGEATCRDIPEFVAYGETLEDIVAESLDLLPAVLTLYQARGSLIPLASAPLENEVKVLMPRLTEAKIGLWNAFVQSGYSQAEAAVRSGMTLSAFNRLMNLFKSSELEGITKATWALSPVANIASSHA